MSLRSSSEKWLQQLADDILGFLVSYLVTFWMVLKNPRTELPHLLSSDEQPKEAMLPGAFLVSNILIVFAIRTIFGFPLPEFPLQLQWSANFPRALLQYLLGLLVLLTLILWRVSSRDFPRGMIRIAPVVCYASVVYIPLSFIGMWFSSAFGGFILDVWASIGNRRLPQFGIIPSIGLLGPSSLLVLCFIWWFYLLHLGMQSVSLTRPYEGRWKALLSASFLFFVAKVGFFVLLAGWFIVTDITTYFQWEELKRVISASPPDCAKAITLEQKISANNHFPVYPRYVAQIVSATCLPVVFFPDELQAKRIRQAIEAIRRSEHERARNVLDMYFTELTKVKASGRKVITQMAREHLKKAEELYQSPQFSELEEDWTNVFLVFPDAPIALFP